MSLPIYPEFEPLDLSMREDLVPALGSGRTGGVADGVSEFTFAGLYLFREQYNYRAAILPNGDPIITGRKGGESFFLLPLGLPQDDRLLDQLFDLGYLKNLSPSDREAADQRLAERGYQVTFDRDNSDYLYRTAELAELPGKRFHKKRNHVNGFRNAYSHTERPLGRDTVHDALAVLDGWRAERDTDGDYRPSREALELYRELGLSGLVVYVDGTPVAYALGEPLPNGDSYVVHCEKALGGYRGVYQYVNSALAATLVGRYTYINREQDLGDPGLRQAKLTYRPVGFVEKFRVVAPVRVPIGSEEPAQACCA